MSNTTQNKLILALMALGLIVMFGASLIQRINNPELTVQARGSSSGASAEQSMPMPPEMGALMQKAKENPRDIPTLIELAEFLIQGKEWQAAETFAHRILEIAPDNAQAHYLHGIILYNTGSHDEAAKAFESVIAIQDDASARYSLGILQIYHFKDIAKGLEQFEKALLVPNTSQELKDVVQAEIDKVKSNNN